MATLVQRRRFMQALAAASAVPAAASAQSSPTSTTASAEEATPVTTELLDIAGPTVPGYFDERRLASLRRICELFMPAMDGKPGAIDVEVPEFLDFYVSQSPDWRRQVYDAGLDTLHSVALAKFGKTFAELSDAQADQIIAKPLEVQWAPTLPDDALAAFLREAKMDVMHATMNARDYADAARNERGRSSVRSASLYWYRVE